MLLLSAPFEPSAGVPPRPPLRGYGQVGLAAAVVAAVGAAIAVGGPSWVGIGQGITVGAVHAGLIAIGWLVATGAAPGWRAPVLRLGGCTILASIAARLGPWGPLALLLVPALLVWETHGRPPMRAMGVDGGRLSHALIGLAAGVFLGAHLLITASLTFGYRVHATNVAAYMGAVAYDVGVNVVSAEWLFRGALFTACWRRGSFWPAALGTTALALVRYLLDPALPTGPEARAGAVFYLGLVGLSACALRAWSGSLLPGYLAGLAFFAAYRTLTP